MSKYYNEDQLAMTAAVASKTHLPLVEENLLASPSIMFKKLLTKAFIRQEKEYVFKVFFWTLAYLLSTQIVITRFMRL